MVAFSSDVKEKLERKIGKVRSCEGKAWRGEKERKESNKQRINDTEEKRKSAFLHWRLSRGDSRRRRRVVWQETALTTEAAGSFETSTHFYQATRRTFQKTATGKIF